jgi:Mrp family chromosome partitioning ATPase
LLIDCDLRRSSVHRRLNLPAGPGLSEVLRGERAFVEVIQPTAISGLSVVTAGKGDYRAVQAIKRMRGILTAAKTHYDFILIDSAPALSVADTLLLGQYVDGVILSILRGVSRVPLAASAQQRFAALGVVNLGAVVSGTREECYGFGYQPAA